MGERLLSALANTLAEMKTMKFGVAVAIVEGIAYAMGQIKADTLVDIVGDVQAEPLVDTLAYVVAELEALTLCATLGYLKPKATVDTLADICRGGSLDCCLDTLEVKAEELVHKQADIIAELKAKACSLTLGDAEAFHWWTFLQNGKQR